MQVNQRALKFIANEQRTDGGFDSLWSTNGAEFDASSTRQTSFFPSLIALALVRIPGSEGIKSRVAEYLKQQKSSDWTFNYWDINSQMATDRPYPNDLDDTFCALTVLHNEYPQDFDGAAMASVAHILFSAEANEGGPYETWLVSEDADQEWHDVDIAVNSNVAFFLSKHEVELPNLNQYFDNCIRRSSVSSRYYSSELPVLYFLSRAYNGELRSKLCEIIINKKGNNFWGSPTYAALAMTSLIHCGYPASSLSEVNDYLIKSQAQDGSWPAAGFCIDSRLNGKGVVSAGSRALSTALCLEALNSYETYFSQAISSKSTVDVYSERLKEQFTKNISSIEGLDLQHSVRSIFDRVLTKDDSHKIIALPILTAKALEIKLSNKILTRLANISLWGWMAYTIYDDFLDEGGDKSALPGANYSLRMLEQSIAIALPNRDAFISEAKGIMSRLDAANAWELSHCRVSPAAHKIRAHEIPDYGDLSQLAERSFGHVLAGLGVMYAKGYEPTSSVVQDYHRFFKHYLIARQLKDDAHDWESDLANGHINSVAAILLRKYKFEEVHVDALKELMWTEVILDVCNLIEEHVNEASSAIANNGEFDYKIFELMLKPLEISLAETRTSRKDILKFVNKI